MREVVMTAASVQEAIRLGCASLGVQEEEAQVEVMEVPRKKLFGYTKAKVRIYLEDESDIKDLVKEAMKEAVAEQSPAAEEIPVQSKQEEAAPMPREKREEPKKNEEIIESLKETKEEISFENLSEKNQKKLEIARAYLMEILQNFGCTAHLVETIYSDGAVLVIEGTGLGTIIGRRGENLDAIQYLTGLVANRGDDAYFRITVDCQGYRDKRVITLQQLAIRMATKAVKTGRSTRLEPMNPFERRVIHAAVSTVEGATSSSYGEEPNRRVMITSKNRPPRDDRRPAGRGRYNNDRSRSPRRDDRGPRRDGMNKPRPAAEPVNTAPARPAKSDFDELGEVGTGLYGKIEL